MDRKVYSRRALDGTPLLRRYFQITFLLLDFWIGARFYLFVRYRGTRGRTADVPRPPGVEGWLPITAAGFFLFVAFLTICEQNSAPPAAAQV